MKWKIMENRLGELFARLDSNQALYLPVDEDGQAMFGRWAPDIPLQLDGLITVNSVKGHFFPQSEDLVGFRRRGKEIDILESRDPAVPFVVFGARACDARSLDILDQVFLSEPADTFYQARRENGAIITAACVEPGETSFCGVFGIDATRPGGDVATWMAGGALYWESLTEKGERLTEQVRDLLTPADDGDEALLAEQRERVQAILDRLPLHAIDLSAFTSDNLNRLFESPAWEELSRSCVGCGTCTFICPTCQCYDVQDYDTGWEIRRFRCWDSCMFSDFTLMAHGNPRTTQKERFRQRFMHKLVYHPSNFDGIFSCVGCGRCIARCPVSMNIAKVIKVLGGNEPDAGKAGANEVGVSAK